MSAGQPPPLHLESSFLVAGRLGRCPTDLALTQLPHLEVSDSFDVGLEKVSAADVGFVPAELLDAAESPLGGLAGAVGLLVVEVSVAQQLEAAKNLDAACGLESAFAKLVVAGCERESFVSEQLDIAVECGVAALTALRGAAESGSDHEPDDASRKERQLLPQAMENS